MIITLTLGWWLVPAIITFLSIGVCIWAVMNDQDGWLAGLQSFIVFLFLFGVSCFSWLIWALCNMNGGS